MKKLFSTNYSEVSFNLALLLLRVISGATMIPHGYMKLKNFSKMSTEFVDPFHLGMKISLSLTIFAEFFCAMLIILGLLTRLATIPLIIVMCVALFSVHKSEIFGDGGMAGLYLAIFGAILLVGPGRASVDGMIGK